MSTNESIRKRPMYELKCPPCVPLHRYNEGVYMDINLENVSTLLFHFYPTLSIELQ